MLKRIFASCMLSIVTLSSAYAGNFYLGPVITYQTIWGNGTHFEGLSPRLAGGYRMGFDDWYFVAGELYVGGTIVSIIDHKGPETTIFVNGKRVQLNEDISLKNTYVYGLSFIPGLVLDANLLGFLRIGAVGTKFKQSGGNVWGYQVGIGLEVSATDKINIRGEFDYNQYQNTNNINTPKSYEYSLGAIYKFGCC